jgi:hypothetical protein
LLAKEHHHSQGLRVATKKALSDLLVGVPKITTDKRELTGGPCNYYKERREVPDKSTSLTRKGSEWLLRVHKWSLIEISTQIIEQRKPKSKVEHHYAKRSTINGKGNNNNPLNISSQKGRQRANCSQKGPELLLTRGPE